jgi:hypothetical protein
MNIGSLYKVKKYFWLLFPLLETAAAVAAPDFLGPAAADASVAAWYSKRFNCEVTDFSLDSYIVFLEEEEDGVFKKVLTSDGLVGWTWFIEHYNDCFEEVKSE